MCLLFDVIGRPASFPQSAFETAARSLQQALQLCSRHIPGFNGLYQGALMSEGRLSTGVAMPPENALIVLVPDLGSSTQCPARKHPPGLRAFAHRQVVRPFGRAQL